MVPSFRWEKPRSLGADFNNPKWGSLKTGQAELRLAEMVANFFFDRVGVRGIVAHDILQMKEAARLKTSEFDCDRPSGRTDDLPVCLDDQIARGPAEPDPDTAFGSNLREFIQRQKTAAHTQICYFAAMVRPVIDPDFRFNLEGDPRKMSFFLCHGHVLTNSKPDHIGKANGASTEKSYDGRTAGRPNPS
jgi:hypothetical protein